MHLLRQKKKHLFKKLEVKKREVEIAIEIIILEEKRL